MNLFCHSYRENISALADAASREIKTPNGKPFPKELAEKILTAKNHEPMLPNRSDFEKIGVNHPRDRISKIDKESGFSAKNSISEAEVSRFIYHMERLQMTKSDHPKGIMARWLYKRYFGDRPLFEKRPGGTPNGIPPHDHSPVRIHDRIIDGDTAKGSVYKPKECYEKGILGFDGLIRESGTDSAESAYKVKEVPVSGFIPDNAKAWTLIALLNPQAISTMKTPRNVKVKYILNCINAFRELVFPDDKKYSTMNPYIFFKDFSRNEVFTALRLIAAWHDYAADTDTAITNDFKDYVQGYERTRGSKEPFLYVQDTTIRFTSTDTPRHMCGMWQPYDHGLRRLVSFVVKHPSLIEGYFNIAFPRTLQRLSKTYNAHEEAISKLAGALNDSANPKIKHLAGLLGPSNFKSPTEMFSNLPEIRKTMDLFYSNHNQERINWTLARILLGSTTFYLKYRHQNGTVFKEADRIAKEKGHGLWGADPTFKAMWNYYLRIPRYKPADCLTGEK